jgi:hypothetical protein
VRGKDYNAGLRGVLFEARHYERMGAAIWLYGWLVLRQTRQQDGVGWVLGGAPVSYREIEEETGFNRRTLERWMQTLRRAGYVETDAVGDGVSVRITKAKKFSKFPRFPQGGRRNAEGGREIAEGRPQNCGANTGEPQQNQQFADRIGSSYVERYKEEKPREIHRDFHRLQNPQKQDKNLSCVNQTINQKHNRYGNQQSQGHTQERQNFKANSQGPEPHISPRQFLAEARVRLQLWRMERDEEVRRELHVGTGPEVTR